MPGDDWILSWLQLKVSPKREGVLDDQVFLAPAMATIRTYPRGYPVIWACKGLNLVADRFIPFPGYTLNHGP